MSTEGQIGIGVGALALCGLIVWDMQPIHSGGQVSAALASDAALASGAHPSLAVLDDTEILLKL